MSIISFSSSMLIVVMYLYTVYVVKKNDSDGSYKNDTISFFGSKVNSRNFFVVSTIIISLLNFPYIYGLHAKFGIEFISFGMGFAVLASFFLILAGITDYNAASKEHYTTSMLFFISMWIGELIFSKNIYDYNSTLGFIGFAIPSVNLVLTFITLIFYKFKENGIEEIVYLTTSGLWIILFGFTFILNI
jgi:hypothetical protein